MATPSATDIISPYYCSYEWVGAVPFVGQRGQSLTPPTSNLEDKPTPLITTSSLREAARIRTTNYQLQTTNPLGWVLLGVSVIIGAVAVWLVIKSVLKK